MTQIISISIPDELYHHEDFVKLRSAKGFSKLIASLLTQHLQLKPEDKNVTKEERELKKRKLEAQLSALTMLEEEDKKKEAKERSKYRVLSWVILYY